MDPRNVLLDRAPGEEGELLVRGPQVFAGYWNRPKETEEALLEGGWFRTGDIVSVDKDDFVTVRDRIKELIITGGFNDSPPRKLKMSSLGTPVCGTCVWWDCPARAAAKTWLPPSSRPRAPGWTRRRCWRLPGRTWPPRARRLQWWMSCRVR